MIRSHVRWARLVPLLWFLSSLWPGLRPLTFEALYSKDLKHSLVTPGSNYRGSRKCPPYTERMGQSVSGPICPMVLGMAQGTSATDELLAFRCVTLQSVSVFTGVKWATNTNHTTLTYKSTIATISNYTVQWN